jgi:hypothetical protein
MIESKEEFNELLNRLKAKDKENKLGKSLQTKLQAFLEVEKLINLPICVLVPKGTLSNLDEVIKKAKHNMDKIKDVDKHIDSIR